MSATLADLSRSVAAALGSSNFEDTIGLGSQRHVVLCLIDGLGYLQLREYADVAPALSELTGASCLAAFPSTTAVGLATIGTGELSGKHGFVGGAFLLPETDRVLNPLHWGGAPSPFAVQPEPTIFEMLSTAGVSVASIGPNAYCDSGLTRAVLRGSSYVGAEDIAQRVISTGAQLRGSDRSLSYVYWPALDRLGHEFGVGTEPWIQGLRDVDSLVEQLVQCLAVGQGESMLVVTSDHGMLNTDPSDRIAVESHAHLREDVVHLAGEPRVRHIYSRKGAESDVLQRWSEFLGERATVMSRSEAERTGLFGELDPFLSDRVGDVVAIAKGTTVLASHVDPLASSLIGQHGSLTDDEMLVPALIHRRH